MRLQINCALSSGLLLLLLERVKTIRKSSIYPRPVLNIIYFSDCNNVTYSLGFVSRYLTWFNSRRHHIREEHATQEVLNFHTRFIFQDINVQLTNENKFFQCFIICEKHAFVYFLKYCHSTGGE